MGRNTKLTPEVQERVLSAIRAGAFQSTAAAYAGVDQSTYARWLVKGELPGAQNEVYRVFRAEVERVEAEVELLAGNTLRTAALDNWQAAGAFLKVRFGKRWREHVRNEVSGVDGAPIAHEVAGLLAQLTDDELHSLARQLERRVPRLDRGGAAEADEPRPVRLVGPGTTIPTGTDG